MSHKNTRHARTLAHRRHEHRSQLTDDYRQYIIREVGKADESKVVSYQLGLINAKKLIRQDTIVW